MGVPSDYNIKLRYGSGYFFIPVKTRMTEGNDYIELSGNLFNHFFYTFYFIFELKLSYIW